MNQINNQISQADIMIHADVGLAQANARLAEASAQLAEANARLAEANDRVAQANIRVAEADARVTQLQAEISRHINILFARTARDRSKMCYSKRSWIESNVRFKARI